MVSRFGGSFDELVDLYDHMDTLNTQLGGEIGVSKEAFSQFEDGELEGAVNDFQKTWDWGIQHICADLSKAVGHLGEAINNYVDLEKSSIALLKDPTTAVGVPGAVS